MNYQIGMVRSFCEAIWEAAGLTHEDARTCVDVLLAGDVRGQRTHGTTHMKDYVERLLMGTTTNGSEIEMELTAPSTLVVDAKYSVGMVAGTKIMRKCIDQARISGACFASVRHGNHYGLGAYYPMMAAKENMIGFSIANTSPIVAPFGGAEPVLGTNPLSVAVPAGRYPDLVLDIATSTVAKGRLSIARKEGKPIPTGWALDSGGRPTTDPAAAEDGGTLLPFGAHKGYGIMLVISLLSCALSGADMDWKLPFFFSEKEKQSNTGYFMGCIDISKYSDVETFKARVAAMFDQLKLCRLSAGSKGVLIPGEIEYGMAQHAEQEGIFLSEATLKDFADMADQFHIEYPF